MLMSLAPIWALSFSNKLQDYYKRRKQLLLWLISGFVKSCLKGVKPAEECFWQPSNLCTYYSNRTSLFIFHFFTRTCNHTHAATCIYLSHNQWVSWLRCFELRKPVFNPQSSLCVGMSRTLHREWLYFDLSVKDGRNWDKLLDISDFWFKNSSVLTCGGPTAQISPWPIHTYIVNPQGVHHLCLGQY